MPKVIEITAPSYLKEEDSISVFLAGGITNCPNWQKEVIKRIREEFRNRGYEDKENYLDLVIFNPRRENFPIDNPNAAYAQIEWEFHHLEDMDIFSMYFCSGESDQPICMYELGRHLERMRYRFYNTYKDRIVVSAETDYRRRKDVEIQMRLALNADVLPRLSEDSTHKDFVSNHACRIMRAYEKLLQREVL